MASGTPGPFATAGVFELAKTSAVAFAVGDRIYWDVTNKVVNNTPTGQKCIGVAVSAAANPSTKVLVKLGQFVAEGT